MKELFHLVGVKRHTRKTKKGQITVKAHKRKVNSNPKQKTKIKKEYRVRTTGYNFEDEKEVYPYSIEYMTMPPEKYLRLTTAGQEEYEVIRDSKSVEPLKELIKNDIPFRDPIWLQVDAETGEVLGHEGRHRSMAALQLGVKEIPVTVRYRYYPKDRGMYITFPAREENMKLNNPKSYEEFIYQDDNRRRMYH